MPPTKTSKATIRDVARQAGVSVATVSRVLNQNAVIAEDTLRRVQQVITELNFVPRAAARSLSNNRTNVIGLLFPEIGWDNFFPPMLRGIENGCYEAGFDLLIHSTRHAHGIAPLRHPVGEQNTDGLLVFTNALTDAEIDGLFQKGFPLVLLHRSPPHSLPIPHVVFKNKAGARKMTDHLIEAHGFRRIAFLAGPPDNEDATWREQGYQESLRAHGLEVDPALVRRGGFDDGIAFQTVSSWLAGGFAAQAIFAADDDSAYGAVRAIHLSGRGVPEDIPVVGFDDSPISSLLAPPLTTIRAPIEEAGYRAARTLASILQAQKSPAPDGGEGSETEILLHTELVIRRSCGCKL